MPWLFTDMREVFILFYFFMYWEGVTGRWDLIGRLDLACSRQVNSPAVQGVLLPALSNAIYFNSSVVIADIV